MNGHIAIVAKLLAAGDVNRRPKTRWCRQSCAMAHADGGWPATAATSASQLLSSLRRQPHLPSTATQHTAEHLATHRGHHDVAAWLPRPASGRRRSTTSSSSRPSARARPAARRRRHPRECRARRADAALARARELAAAGGAAEGTAAFLVLEAAKPWSRKMHKIFPPAARARVADLMRIAQAIKRGKAAYESRRRLPTSHSPGSVADVFEGA